MREPQMLPPPHQIHFEPYKIKMIEPIWACEPLSPQSRARRLEILKQAHYNLFNVPSREVTIDLLTDSGTGAMSQEQWSALMVGDESYAQATSFERFERSIKEVIGEDFYIIPTHQGRAAENILFYVLNQLAQERPKGGGRKSSPSSYEPLRRRILINSFFDTTAANVLLHGRLTDEDFLRARELIGDDIPDAEQRGADPEIKRRFEYQLKYASLIARNQLVISQREPENFPHGIFGGNIDLGKLEAILEDPYQRQQVLMVMLTVTNNTGGGLPVSMENIRQVREMIDHYCRYDPPLGEGVPPVLFFFDACRFAENAYFIQQYEPGFKERTVADIAREMFTYVDGCTMSAKKDGLANIGGFLATRWEPLKVKCWEHMVEIEGFYTYGGLAGRDLEAIAVGIKEGVDDLRVRHRVLQVQHLWQLLNSEEVPVKKPCGGHGVFLMGRAFWTWEGRHLIDPHDLPGHTLAVALYHLYGIRSCEIGTVMFGDWDPQTGRATRLAPDEDYVRLAIPRRVYTESHLEYVASAIGELYKNRCQLGLKGMRFVYRPAALPHFLSHFKPIESD